MVIPRIMAYYPKSQSSQSQSELEGPEDMVEREVNPGFQRNRIRPMQQIKGIIFQAVV